MNRRARKGFTLLEMLVSIAMLSIVAAGTVTATQRGLALFRRSMSNVDVNARSGRAAHRIARELYAVNESSLFPDMTSPVGGPPFWSPTLDYREAVDWDGAGLTLGPTRRIVMGLAPGELDNGIDDDGDGLIDEGVVELVISPDQVDEQRVTLVEGVSEFLEGEIPNGIDDNGNDLVDERGLSFHLDDGILDVRLSVETIGPDGDLQIRTNELAIDLRN